VKEKILDGFEFESNIDKAAELNPGNHTHHCWAGSAMKSVSFHGLSKRWPQPSLLLPLPSASLPEAIDHFLQAERLKPDGWKENRLFIAKCHIGLGEYNRQ
jgi:hypothetical protein